MNKANVVLVNNTQSNISDFDDVILNCVYNNSELPEELSDLFNLKLVNVDGNVRGILNAV